MATLSAEQYEALFEGADFSRFPDAAFEDNGDGSVTLTGAAYEEMAATIGFQQRDAIKAECARRIFAIADRNAQVNTAMAAATGLLDEADMAAAQAAQDWVRRMRERCQQLIARENPSYLKDEDWPSCPEEVIDLSAKF